MAWITNHKLKDNITHNEWNQIDFDSKVSLQEQQQQQQWWYCCLDPKYMWIGCSTPSPSTITENFKCVRTAMSSDAEKEIVTLRSGATKKSAEKELTEYF